MYAKAAGGKRKDGLRLNQEEKALWGESGKEQPSRMRCEKGGGEKMGTVVHDGMGKKTSWGTRKKKLFRGMGPLRMGWSPMGRRERKQPDGEGRESRRWKKR